MMPLALPEEPFGAANKAIRRDRLTWPTRAHQSILLFGGSFGQNNLAQIQQR
jgi:hypothetical protein